MSEKKIVYKTELPKEERDNKFARTLGVVILFFCVSIVSFVGGRVFQEYAENPLSMPFFRGPSIVNRSEFNQEVVEDFDVTLFWEVWDTLHRSYVDETVLDEKQMYYGAIKGMVSSLGDPGTIFLTPEEAQLFKQQSEGRLYEGIGAELGYRDGAIVVISPIEGSPAKAAGIQPGDLIVKVDDETVKPGDSIYEIVNQIRGDAGTEVVITVMRRGEVELRDIPIARGEITVPSMTLERDEDSGIYVLKVGRFTDASLQSWNSLWDEKVEIFLKSGDRDLIVDLRGNPGGFFDAGVYAAEEFLDKGTIIAKQEDRRGKTQNYQVGRNGKLLDVNVVVLVNEGSASASEIFAGALQQANRAKIVGENTYGKGTAQSVISLDDGSSLHLTIIKWLLPDGSWIKSDNVIEPDAEVEFTDEAFTKGMDPQLDTAVEILSK